VQAVSGNIQDHLDASKAESQRLRSDMASQEDRIKLLEEQLYQAESLRRKLHNTIQELKGTPSWLSSFIRIHLC
jgi:kinesin family protein C1